LGFELDEKRIPTFRYRYAGMTVRERITPLPEGKGLRRVFSIEGARDGLRFRGATHYPIRMHVGTSESSDSDSVLITPTDGRVEITQEIEW
jgi:hypothetical protein